MAVIPVTADELLRCFRRTLLLRGRSEEAKVSPLYEEIMKTAEHFYSWKPIGIGVEVLNWGETHLIRVVFTHTIAQAATDESKRLKDSLDVLGASIRRAIPLSASARLKIEPCSSKAMRNGIEVECFAHGIVESGIPNEIVEFMLSKGVEVVSGKRSEWGDDRLGTAELFPNRYYYQLWHLAVRSINDPQKTCRVVVERPQLTNLPMLVTGLDLDDDDCPFDVPSQD